ncbi:MAG: biotin--[Clostridia bacterium]|nr:biotin--[acetyl-CoA-carboxylase] ligase [Clostridia bacterium]
MDTNFKNDSNKLSENGIRQFLKSNTDRKIIIFDEVTSTNTLAKELLKSELDGAMLLSEKQTAGRGRMGRSFFSPDGSGIYMSIGLKPKIAAEKSVLITVAAAVAVSRALDLMFGVDTEIKWVNDIYYKGKKVCGILTEAVFENESGKILNAVLGIGINVNMPKGGFPEDIKDKAGAISSADHISRNRIAAEVVNQFDMIYKDLETAEFLEEYRKKSCLIGKKVLVMPIHNEQYYAVVKDIDEKAQLVVKTEGGRVLALSGGEVSIVPEL